MTESISPFLCGHYQFNRGLLVLDAGGEPDGLRDVDDRTAIILALRLHR